MVSSSSRRKPESMWLALLFLATTMVTSEVQAAACGTSSGIVAITICEDELAKHPGNINLRIKYADLLVKMRRNQEAATILRKGIQMHPSNALLKQRYQLATSLAEEQDSIDRISSSAPKAKTKGHVKEILCKKLKGKRALKACNEVLKDQPNNLIALTRKGDELMALNRVTDAVASYRKAIALDRGNASLKHKLATAKARLPKKTQVAVTNKPPAVKAPGSKPKISPPKVTIIAKTTTEISKEPASANELAKMDKPVEITRYSNGPFSDGVTF